MVKEAQSHADEDRKRKEQQEARNIADTAIYSAEKSLRDYADKLTDDQKQGIQQQIDAARDAVNSGDGDRMRSATEELQRALMSIGEAMYGQPSGDGAGQEQRQAGGEDVVEGEVVE
jgi:molecular chaperone DnaK